MKYHEWKIATVRRALQAGPLTVSRSGWLYRKRRIFSFQIAKQLIVRGEAVRLGDKLVLVRAQQCKTRHPQ